MVIKLRETIGQEAKQEETKISSNLQPFEELQKRDFKDDYETLQRTPINQPIVKFLEEVRRIIDDVNYDNNHEIQEVVNEFNNYKIKEYNKDLNIVIAAVKLKALYEKQITKLMEFPNISSKAILEMQRIHKKTKGIEND